MINNRYAAYLEGSQLMQTLYSTHTTSTSPGHVEHIMPHPTQRFVQLLAQSLGLTAENFNPLKPNDPYKGRTAPLTSKRCILYIYSTNIGTECFKHGICSPFIPLQNAVCFIILMYLVPVLFTFYIQGVLKI